jgi:diguanylate cyclase (GGDEF)-like protein/PAS domain S-box-containing protein
MKNGVEQALKLRVLMLEDLELDAELCRHELKSGGLDCSFQRVDTRAAFERALDEWAPRLILSDFSMPNFDGMSALEIARVRAPSTPFIFLSGTIGEERAVEAMKRGATDYVLKHHINRLVPIVRRALREQSERDALQTTGRTLNETRERLDGILASLSDAVWSVSLAPLELIYANAATESVYGRPLGDFISKPGLVLDAVVEADRAYVHAAWQQAAQGGSFDVEHRVVVPDGEVRWVHVRAQGVRDAEGRVVRIDGITRNVSRRRSAEERVARLSRVRAVLSGINAATVRVRDRQQLYDDACHIAVHEGGFAYAWIGELDETAGRIELRAHCCETSRMPVIGAMAPGAGEVDVGSPGLVAIAARTGRVALSNGVAHDEPIMDGADEMRAQFRSAAVVPIKMADRVVGVLGLFGVEPDFFGEQETRLLDELSGNLSFALDYMHKAASLDHLAYYDALTGLPNRRLFFDRLAQLASHAAAEKSEFAIMVVDLARFRSINETMGTSAGDAVLLQVAERLLKAAGTAGTCARITADRFALTLHESVRNGAGATLALEHALKSLEAPFSVAGSEVRVQARGGVSIFPVDGASPETLFANAEAALSNAKVSAARLVFYAREMNARAAEMLQLENELRIALRDEQFVLYYQPRVSLASGRVCGLEALIRWLSPARGLVPPSDFIPLLEHTGLILEVGRWALRRAAADAAAWAAGGMSVPSIGVNVSAVQLREKDFVEDVISTITGADRPHPIELELTESMVMADVEGTARKLEAIRTAGMRISIDDFGTGYSSLAYLARLPVDALKIDRSFVSSMETNPLQMAIVTTVISLARSLGLTAVAEGVETESQARVLAALHCDEGQGFLYSRPVPAQSIPALIEALGGSTPEQRSADQRVAWAAAPRTVSRLRKLLRR